MLDGRIPRLQAHSSFDSASIEASSLQAEGNDVEERNELREDEGFDRTVSSSLIGELLDNGFDFGGRSPIL